MGNKQKPWEYKPEALEVVIDFMSPFEDRVDVIALGDHITDELFKELETNFNNLRNLFNQIPGMSKNHKLGKVNMSRFTTAELFRGAASENLKGLSTIYLDPELSSQLINILNADDNQVDELDIMLLDKYLLQEPQEKYILDITDTPEDALQKIIYKMDSRPAEFNYLVYGNYLAIWIYFNDELTLMQVD